MNFRMANILIILGAAILVAGLFLKFRKVAFDKEKSNIITETKNALSSKTSDDNYEENKQKGDAFEKYVVQQFNRDFFTLMEWRSDKYVNGIYAVSNHFPDLEVMYTAGRTKDSFAIECKWRKRFYKNEVEWAQHYQVENYKKYAKEVKLPVFIVIGIGGEPGNPKEIYIVPLDSAKTNVFTISDLLPYKKYRKDFYWDVSQKALK